MVRLMSVVVAIANHNRVGLTLSRQRVANLLNDGIKTGWIVDRHFRKRFSIELDACLFQAEDKFVVWHPSFADRRINSDGRPT